MPVSGGLYKKDSPICMWKHQELRRKEKDCTAHVRCEDLSTFYGPRKTRDTRLVPKGTGGDTLEWDRSPGLCRVNHLSS